MDAKKLLLAELSCYHPSLSERCLLVMGKVRAVRPAVRSTLRCGSEQTVVPACAWLEKVFGNRRYSMLVLIPSPGSCKSTPCMVPWYLWTGVQQNPPGNEGSAALPAVSSRKESFERNAGQWTGGWPHHLTSVQGALETPGGQRCVEDPGIPRVRRPIASHPVGSLAT